MERPISGPIAFIGVGKLGRPMAARLSAAGYRLTVYDREPRSTQLLKGPGVRVAHSPADAVANSQAVLTCLPGPQEFEELLFAHHGIAKAMPPGAILVDHTTNSPQLIADARDKLAELGITLIDAPVSGGVEGAANGALTALVGGDRDQVQRVRPILKAACSTIFHVGATGSGTIAKLLNNLACFTLDQVIAECMTIGVRAGLEPQRLFEALRQSAIGKGANIGVRIPQTFMNSDFEPRFTLNGARKDLALALQMAERLGVPLRISPLALQELDEAVQRGYGDRDASIAMTLQEQRAGVRARP